MTDIYKIQLLPAEREDTETSSTIIISSYLEKQTNTVEGTKITVKIGQCEVICQVRVNDSQQKQTIFCSADIYHQIFLPKQALSLCLRIEGSKNVWEFGPFIGIVTDQIQSYHFGSIHSFIEELYLYGQLQHAFVYVFSLEGLKGNRVHGYAYSTEKKCWIDCELPLPDVVHNRIHSRLREKSAKGIRFFENLQSAAIPYFNERFLTKWNIYESLSSCEQLLPYLPETKLMNGIKTLEEMMSKYPLLFLKPVHGSQGKNIFRIVTTEKNFKLNYTTFSGTTEFFYHTIPPLYEAIRPRLQKQRYIIQEGLTLLTFEEDRPLDFRLLCHRLHDTKWLVTSTIARVSPKYEFVSNLARGGEIFKTRTILETLFDKKTAIQIEFLLKEIAIETVTIIDQHADGVYGEFGVDLALDQEGRPWIIEINTKPSKNLEPDGFSPKIRPSAKAVLHYCHHLSGWNI